MRRTIIAISGKLCAGKTTLANALCEADNRFTRLALADELKRDIAELCEVTLEYIDEHKDQFRELMQIYGVLMRELHGKDYWVIRLVDKMHDFNLMDVIVDDVRFPNELAGLRKYADRFLSVRLNLTEEEQERRCIEKFGAPLSWAKLHHTSETALDDYDGFDLTIDAVFSTEWQVKIVLEELRLRGMIEGVA